METKVVQLIADINADAPDPIIKLTVKEIVAKSLVRQDINPPKPEVVFALNDMPIFTKKSLSMISGKAGKGKTTVISWIIAKLILLDVKVAWIDTEQGEYYASRTQSWTLKQSGLSTCDNLKYFDLRTYSPKERIEIIEEIIIEFQPHILIIDGIRDLMLDINNTEESTHIIGHLLRWSDQNNIHILNVLHENKKDGNARGHIGTELTNKAETVIKIEQNDDNLIVCSPEKVRAKSFDAFAFERDDHGIPHLVEGFSGKISITGGERGRKSIDPTDTSYNAAHIDIVDKCFSKEPYLKYDDVVRNIKHFFQLNGVELGLNKSKEFLTHYIQTGIVWKNPYLKGYAKYEKNPKFEGFPYISPTINAVERDAPF